MKNITFDQFKQTYENWKSSGLFVGDYCSNTGFAECLHFIIRAQAFWMQYIYNYRQTLHKVFSTDYNNFLHFLS